VTGGGAGQPAASVGVGEQLGFHLDLDRCVQCHACEVACGTREDHATRPGLRRVVGLWAGSYPALASRTISYSCMHCGRPDCVDACPSGAIAKRTQDGIVLIDREECSGCRACEDACPFGAIVFDAEDLAWKCDACIERIAVGRRPVCVETCPTEALRFGPMRELAALPGARELAGASGPSMLITSERWDLFERALPWK
jgi:anaerobic dimethyl sulfoxide reductase subunit B